MDKKNKTVLWMFIFIAFIGIAYFAYNSLVDRYKPERSLTLNDSNNNQVVEKETTSAADDNTNNIKNNSADIDTTEGSKENQIDDSKETTEQEEKTKAPDFTVTDSNGNSVKLSDFFGKPIVLNFWASWCPPCKSEMPDFNEVYLDVKDEIQFMMVDMVDGQKETKEKGAKYVEDKGFGFPVFYDIEQDAAYTYGIRSIPTTVFIDKDGYIITGAEGAIEKEMLMKGIEYIK